MKNIILPTIFLLLSAASNASETEISLPKQMSCQLNNAGQILTEASATTSVDFGIGIDTHAEIHRDAQNFSYGAALLSDSKTYYFYMDLVDWNTRAITSVKHEVALRSDGQDLKKALGKNYVLTLEHGSDLRIKVRVECNFQ